ncbi:MAG: serine hydrolase domain-containing protein [Burkholderiales bacterium]
MKTAIDALLGRAVDMGDVPGVAAMVTSREGTLYEGAFGKRMLGGEAPMELDTVCWLASLTKALVAAGAMQLVERGVLDLNEPVRRRLPELGEAMVLEGFDDDGRPRLRAPARAITLRHLLTHTAGFGYEFWNAEIMKYQQATGTPGTGSGMNASLGTPLLFEPGERWNYGINIDWTGKLIEAVSGMKLGEYLAKNLFVPLGMDSTGFRITPDMRARLAKIHQRDSHGALAPVEREVRQDPEFESGGGGLYSTARDYLKFVRMMLGHGEIGGRRVLKPDTVALMARNHIGETRVTPLKAQFPALSNDAEFFPGVPKSWGLSFQINEAPAPTGRPSGGLMWGGLSNTYYWIDPFNGVGGVYLTQILPFCDLKSLPLFYAFEAAVYAALDK